MCVLQLHGDHLKITSLFLFSLLVFLFLYDSILVLMERLELFLISSSLWITSYGWSMITYTSETVETRSDIKQ
jgi:hypothetical protein